MPCEWVSAIAPRNDKIDQLTAENAKLRKLVRDMHAFLAWADGATHYGGEPAVHTSDRKEVEQRMCELGIEVDE